MSQEKHIWNEYLEHSSIDKIFDKHRKIFLSLFEKKWANSFTTISFDLCQIETGNRLRPQILFFGYLATVKDFNTNQLDYIVDLAISIELIHKSSILLDDLIDDDKLRHNKPTFHAVHGRDKAILFSLNLSSKALINLKKTLFVNKVENNVYRKCIELSIQTLYDISFGALSELSMNKKQLYDLNYIKQIIDLETATLLKNSLLLGYYSNNGCNRYVEEIFTEIGQSCGYIFQVMNDLEPFCNAEKIKLHKGSINTDHKNLKKNIAIAFLYERMSGNDRREFSSIDFSNVSLVAKAVEDYFQQYKVIQSFMDEIMTIEIKIAQLIDKLKQYKISQVWCENFKFFVSLLAKVAKSRLH